MEMMNVSIHFLVHATTRLTPEKISTFFLHLVRLQDVLCIEKRRCTERTGRDIGKGGRVAALKRSQPERSVIEVEF